MTDYIEIRGLEVMGTHGVYDFEKSRPQPFVVDLILSIDLREACSSDDIHDTISYSAFVNEVRRVIEGPSCNLLEKLADRIAVAVLKDERVTQAEITIRKPRAPVSTPMKDVGVRIIRP